MSPLLLIWFKRADLLLSAIAIALIIGCGAQQIEPLDPKDTTLSQDTRRWIAAAEDGVVVARARRDAAKEQLERAQARQERVLDEIDFGSKGAKVVDTLTLRFERLNAYLEARLDRAEAVLALTEAKYDLATAEQAILHDLARYDVEEIKQKVEQARQQLLDARKRLRQTREALDRTTTTFWQVYSQYVKQGGETLRFWIGKGSAISIAKTGSQTTTTGKPEDPAVNPRSNVNPKDLPTNPF
jgi:DNA repair exonuclease SbcCD ATPase subunit